MRLTGPHTSTGTLQVWLQQSSAMWDATKRPVVVARAGYTHRAFPVCRRGVGCCWDDAGEEINWREPWRNTKDTNEKKGYHGLQSMSAPWSTQVWSNYHETWVPITLPLPSSKSTQPRVCEWGSEKEQYKHLPPEWAMKSRAASVSLPASRCALRKAARLSLPARFLLAFTLLVVRNIIIAIVSGQGCYVTRVALSILTPVDRPKSDQCL